MNYSCFGGREADTGARVMGIFCLLLQFFSAVLEAMCLADLRYTALSALSAAIACCLRLPGPAAVGVARILLTTWPAGCNKQKKFNNYYI